MKAIEGPEEFLSGTRILLEGLEATLPRKLEKVNLDSAYEIPMAYVLSNLMGYRLKDMASIAARMFEEKSTVAGLILTRAALETLIVFTCLSQEVETFLQGSRDEGAAKKLNDRIVAMMLASREPGTLPEFLATNILTLLKRVGGRFGGIQEEYESLCEFAHPNVSGLLGTYGKPGPDPESIDIEFIPANFPAYQWGAKLLFRIVGTFGGLYQEQQDLLNRLDEHALGAGKRSVRFS